MKVQYIDERWGQKCQNNLGFAWESQIEGRRWWKASTEDVKMKAIDNYILKTKYNLL